MSELTRRMDAIDRAFGRGETLAPADRERILEGVLPAWLLAGRAGLKGELQQRCGKAVDALLELHKGVSVALKAIGGVE